MIRTAFIGMGYRGRQLLALLRQLPEFTPVAVADPEIRAGQCDGLPCYNQGEHHYQRMIREEQPDLVVVASPWKCHVEHAMYALQQGCHVALEIKGGLAINEYKPLAKLTAQSGKQVFPLENTLFKQEILAVKRMVDEDVLGKPVYMRGGYRHDLRDVLIDDEGRWGQKGRSESGWRCRFYEMYNGDLYPTHSLAPLCMIADINRSDRVVSLCSQASRAEGVNRRIDESGGPEHVDIATGDVVCTQLKTERGVLIALTHDTTLPRPRSLDYEVQGTRGIWQGEHRRIYIEGISPKETWESDEPYINRYQHRYWREWGREALAYDKHHQGMDYIMLRAVGEAIEAGIRYPATVHDLALWTSVTPLSIRSIERQTVIRLDDENA